MAVQHAPTEELLGAWNQILVSLKGRLQSPHAYETWFTPIVPLGIGEDIVELEVPNAFFVDWIHEHHLATLKQSLAEVLASEPEIRFVAREATPTPAIAMPAGAQTDREPPPAPRKALGAPAGRGWLESQLNPRHTFETFVVGTGNRFTHAGCLAVALSPGLVYNPLFIFGGSGLGKTHLLHAIGHAVRLERPDARVRYVPAERFTNEMIYAIQHGQTLAFRNKYRNVDVLLIDDIQFLAGKEGTQEEFFYTFNALRDAHKQVVVTSDKAPKDLPMLEERLTSRFNQGLVTDVQMPDIETRIAILRNRCEQEDARVVLPEDVLLLIADRIRNNIRDLEGCLVRLFAFASLTRRDVDVALAEEVLQQYVNPEPDQLTPERIVKVVCDRFAVRTDALFGKRRTRSIALPRQVAMYLLRQLTEMSFVEIGVLFGNRDHTTVMYACDKVGSQMADDREFADKINGLISALASV